MENIYDENPIDPTEWMRNVTPSKKDKILFFDCDSPLTLMTCIKQIRRLVNTQSIDTPITLYFVKGLTVPFNFGWDFLWNYLVETGFIYNIVFRGYIETDALSIFDPKYDDVPFTVIFSKDIRHREIDIVKHLRIYNIKPNFI